VVFNSNISIQVKLRDLRLPEDYKYIAMLYNSIEPGSTTEEVKRCKSLIEV
jgi:hypothetical protein